MYLTLVRLMFLLFNIKFPTRKRIRKTKVELPPLSGDMIPKTRSLSEKEINRYYEKKAKFEHQQSMFKLAQTSMIGYFSTLALIGVVIILCNFKGLDSQDSKWVFSRFLETSSPLVGAVVFYYYGQNETGKPK